jgi:hypothetical protein
MGQDEWTTYDNPPSARFSLISLSLLDAEEAPIRGESRLEKESPPASILSSLVDRRTPREMTVFVDIELK